MLTNLTEEPGTFEKEFERPEKETSIYIDGAFDLVHSGHFNAIRQAAALATKLVVGCNTDEDILVAKGPTILNVVER